MNRTADKAARFIAAERYMQGFRDGTRGNERRCRHNGEDDYLVEAYAAGWAAGYAALERARNEAERRYLPRNEQYRPALRLIRGGQE